MSIPKLGVGFGWRPELAALAARLEGLRFVEVVAENMDHGIPKAIDALRARGVAVVPHGVSLAVGNAELPLTVSVERLAKLQARLGSPFVSEHLCFVRGGGLESGHLLPVPRTRESLEIVVENVKAVQSALPVPFVIENIAAFFEWPGNEMDEATFLARVVERTDAWLLVDVANLHANARNLGWDPIAFLDRLPLERLAYVHVAGGEERQGFYHDTHAHAVVPSVLELLGELAARMPSPNVLLERDDNFPGEAVIEAELETIRSTLSMGGLLHV
ncbi:MAG TPA: DUF692 domain-containing protein [Planctomycetota bacterium]|nr:DUF692 domain-containing protein [Planctomycetota bacterium]